ncbi:hypothetical protein Ae201684P_004171 [Aphanomyces euteiches]|uniref:Uncharacterized protein n=1 Tax=Aphanomyces euteiches TaxID=100861 RepID=A0A6G0XSH4_9STRA|nr:hypothetical protein Ae201684_001698 [Aphanomyces euteiches]KAH9075492.1 hypothetical protein Ae201684P_004171 [Aphanomyces euteiches]
MDIFSAMPTEVETSNSSSTLMPARRMSEGVRAPAFKQAATSSNKSDILRSCDNDTLLEMLPAGAKEISTVV